LQSLLDGSGTLTTEAVHACLLAGMGLLIAPTSDAGAISVTLYDGQDRYKSYASTAEEFAVLLETVRDRGDARSATATPARSPKPAVKRT